MSSDHSRAQLHRDLRAQPGDLERWIALARLQGRSGARAPDPLARDHLATLLELWSRTPELRALGSLILPVLGLVEAQAPAAPRGWWTQAGLRGEASRGDYDRRTGMPLEVVGAASGRRLRWLPPEVGVPAPGAWMGRDLEPGFTGSTWVEAARRCQELEVGERLAGRLPETWTYRLPTVGEWLGACKVGVRTSLGLVDMTGEAWQACLGGRAEAGAALPRTPSETDATHGERRPWAGGIPPGTAYLDPATTRLEGMWEAGTRRGLRVLLAPRTGS